MERNKTVLICAGIPAMCAVSIGALLVYMGASWLGSLAAALVCFMLLLFALNQDDNHFHY